MKDLKKKIQDISNSSVYNQARIAEKIGIHRGLLSEILSGSKPMPIWVAYKLEKLIGVDAKQLLFNQLEKKIESSLTNNQLKSEINKLKPLFVYDYEAIYAVIKNREDYRLSVKQIGDAIGVEYQKFLKFSKGKPIPDKDIENICKFYELNQSDFIVKIS